jgi:hypothetical protein
MRSALTEDGLVVYAWGRNVSYAGMGNPHVEEESSTKPVEALRGVRVGSVAAAVARSYAFADTGEVWAWGMDGADLVALDHGERMLCPLPKPFESLQGIKVDAVVEALITRLHGKTMGACTLGAMNMRYRQVPSA